MTTKNDVVSRIESQLDIAAQVRARLVGVAFDITERKQAEEQMSYALREVHHRSKNLLSVVQAIVRQTARTETRREFVELLSEHTRGARSQPGSSCPQ